MIPIDLFLTTAEDTLDKDLKSDTSQRDAILSDKNTSLYIIAGPGSGKTTVMALRVLKLIFVDGEKPEQIVLTTFTRRAAQELRSRVLGWGDDLRQSLLNQIQDENTIKFLSTIDLNKIYVGTIDSLAQDIMAEYKSPGEIEPVVIEKFVSTSIMLRFGLFDNGRHNSTSLEDLLKSLSGEGAGSLNARQKAELLLTIKDQVYTNMVDLKKLEQDASQNKGILRLTEALNAYFSELDRRNLLDYGKLETIFDEKLRNGYLRDFLSNLKFIMIDEYQDTNLLQESIYFRMGKSAVENGGSIVVVGDDDQSLYRFRGATVELFRNFVSRFKSCANVDAKSINLYTNYRSTLEIIDFVNAFVGLDSKYQASRVPGKPKISPPNGKNKSGLPVLGIFRDNISDLVSAVSGFIEKIVNEGGFTLNNGDKISLNANAGSAADLAVLMHSPREYASSGKERLPLLLSNQLNDIARPLKLFNPRGRDISTEPAIKELLGLILMIIDGDKSIQESIVNLPREVQYTFNEWEIAANKFLNDNKHKLANSRTLQDYVQESRDFILNNGKSKKAVVHLNKLIYDLVGWMPDLHNDLIGLAYLELITRAVEQSAMIEPLSGIINLGQGKDKLRELSIKDIIWDIMVPIATNSVEINEDLLETVPSDRINVLSIHQSKGLEFPMVIVDVGSDFAINHWKQAFKRFPEKVGSTSALEDFILNYSPLGKSSVKPIDRDFNDLYRDYFVAYSRPQDCLVLVGLSASINGKVKNVATGWTRDSNNEWGQLSKNVKLI